TPLQALSRAASAARSVRLARFATLARVVTRALIRRSVTCKTLNMASLRSLASSLARSFAVA
ncbi:MAG TPA: hypothetical protein VFT39_14525, partial [Vicinamibacterales bacterium]|nr:hypothetical protein [Vicinamibacterales bacterium]